jgi:hypothetical protein
MTRTPNRPQYFSAGPSNDLRQQSQMFARTALIEYPPKERTADSLGEVEADDGHRYYIKGDANGTPVRASEWISTHLAEFVGIGTPPFAAIQCLDGSEVYGSRRISGVSDSINTMVYLTTPTQSNFVVPPSGLSKIISSIYVFDMFIYNVDRHYGNYLSVEDSGTRRLYAFDFSRALFWRWPWVGFPEVNENTRTHGKELKKAHGFDAQAAIRTLERLSAVAPEVIEGFVNTMPSGWLATEVRTQLIGWWASGARMTRINELRSGIGDGSLL